MTNRINALTVTLTDDIREDDAEKLVSAIHLLTGVLSVDKHVRNIDSHVNETRVKHEIVGTLLQSLAETNVRNRTK